LVIFHKFAAVLNVSDEAVYRSASLLYVCYKFSVELYHQLCYGEHFKHKYRTLGY